MTSVIVGTAGHIDHGKSALVRALTGTDPDRLKEEKARGITIDLGFAHAEINATNFAFVDVPGHERFVKNMLAGVGGIDLVVLVVAADESVMPQTREHFDICRLLQVPAGLVALTKSDLVDAETLEIAREDVRQLVAGSFLEGAPIVAVSSTTGSGLDALREALAQVSAVTRRRPVDGVARLPIDRVFSMKGFGTVATGTLVSGRIAVDGDLIVMPGERSVKVRGVQVHGERREAAVAGQRAAVNLGGVDVADLSRGQNLVTAGAFAESRVADAVVEVLPDARPLRHGARVRFHQGTAEIIGRVGLIDPRATPIEPGARGFIRLRLESQAVLARGDRYILRAYSPATTIAGGVILDPVPPRTRVRSAAAAERLQALTGEGAVAAMVADAGPAGMPKGALVWRGGIDPRSVDASVERLVTAGVAAVAGDILTTPETLARLQESIVTALTEHHRAQPLSDGVPREALRAQRFRRGHPQIFDRALARLAESGTIVLRDRVALASHRVALTPDEERARAAIDRAFREGGLKPPDVATLAAAIGAAEALTDRMLKLLQRQKVLVKLDVLLFHEEALQNLKAEVAALKKAAGAPARIDVAAFKERYGVSRKFAIPLLEYLDRERITRRAGDARIVL